jgi:ankyrin repeat protein
MPAIRGNKERQQVQPYQAPQRRAEEQREPTPNERLMSAVNKIVISQILSNPQLTCPESQETLRNIDQALAQGATINYQNKAGYTALIRAAYWGMPETTQHLLNKNADPNIRENLGYNAYQMADYYVRQYSNWKRRNKDKPLSEFFTKKHKNDQRSDLEEKINRYSQVTDILANKTDDLSEHNREDSSNSCTLL